MKTSVVRGSAARQKMRVLILLTLAAAVVMMLHVPAMALTQVNLHEPHVGANSETFNTEGDTGGLTDAVVWHFVLNGLDGGTPPGTIYVTFASAGQKTATGIPVGEGMVQTQHFYVGTPTHDTIVSAYALVDSENYINLVLSHVALNEVEPPNGEEPPINGEDPPNGEEPPINGEDPPNGEEAPPVDEEAPPVDEEAPPVDEEAPPVTAEEEEEEAVVVREEAEPFLPFTGADLGLLSLAAAATAALGAGLRRLGLR